MLEGIFTAFLYILRKRNYASFIFNLLISFHFKQILSSGSRAKQSTVYLNY